jgi:hypothetical protein
MGIYLPDLMKERKIKTVPVWIDGKRILIDKYSREYRTLLSKNKQLRLSFIRENAACDGHAAMQQYRSGYVIFGDEVCLVVGNLPPIGNIHKEGRKWVI